MAALAKNIDLSPSPAKCLFASMNAISRPYVVISRVVEQPREQSKQGSCQGPRMCRPRRRSLCGQGMLICNCAFLLIIMLDKGMLICNCAFLLIIICAYMMQ